MKRSSAASACFAVTANRGLQVAEVIETLFHKFEHRLRERIRLDRGFGMKRSCLAGLPRDRSSSGRPG